jgi:hypothetical protein
VIEYALVKADAPIVIRSVWNIAPDVEGCWGGEVEERIADGHKNSSFIGDEFAQIADYPAVFGGVSDVTEHQGTNDGLVGGGGLRQLLDDLQCRVGFPQRTPAILVMRVGTP